MYFNNIMYYFFYQLFLYFFKWYANRITAGLFKEYYNLKLKYIFLIFIE